MKTISVPVKEHDYSFDFLRTVAMLGVILYHVIKAYRQRMKVNASLSFSGEIAEGKT